MPSRATVIAAGSLAVLAALVALLALDPASWFAARPTGNKLVVFCAAGLKAPVARVAREYEEKFGVEVQLQYGGSNTLLASLQVSPLADVYIPADDSYVTLARDKGLIRPSNIVAVGCGPDVDDQVLKSISTGTAFRMGNSDAAFVALFQYLSQSISSSIQPGATRWGNVGDVMIERASMTKLN